MYDVVPARDVTSSNGVDVLCLKPGDDCFASFASRQYDAKVIARGKHITCAYTMYDCHYQAFAHRSMFIHSCDMFLGKYTEMKRAQEVKEKNIEETGTYSTHVHELILYYRINVHVVNPLRMCRRVTVVGSVCVCVCVCVCHTYSQPFSCGKRAFVYI